MSFKLNINRLLETSKRSDVRGYNIYTAGVEKFDRPTTENGIMQKWAPPSLGLRGKVAIGYQIDKSDLIIPVFSVNGRTLEFQVMRNRWTPAFMDTYYRCLPFGEYKNSGLIAIREKKCFTKNDTFISHVTIFNDGREPITMKLSLVLPFNRQEKSIYAVEAKIVPASLRKSMMLKGFASAMTNLGEEASLTIMPNSSATVKYGFAFSCDDKEIARNALNEAFKTSDPFTQAEIRFNEWMERNAPVLITDSTDIMKIYYYRFFVIKAATHTPSLVLRESEDPGESVYESPFGSWFGAPVGLSVPLQIQDMKWMGDSSTVRSAIYNWRAGHGSVRGYIQFTPMAIWQTYLHTADKSIIEDYYESAKGYTLHGCPDGQGALPITVGSWITGTEYQPAFYQHTDPKWDWRHDNEGVAMGFRKSRIYRLDESTMLAANLLACKEMARLLEKDDEYDMFSSYASAVIESMRNVFWDEGKRFFFDRDAESKKPCDEAYGYDGFMPMMFSIFGKEYHCVFDKLVHSGVFKSEFSLTSIGKNCPMYWFDNCITGPVASDLSEPHMYGCCWNGPVWPYAVSLVLEALGNASYTSPDLTDTFAKIFAEYTELHFDFGDRSTPCICEHYRPSDGISFSPYTEYFHSEWLNLFFSYYLGIKVTENGISFNPISADTFKLEGVMIQGKKYNFSQEQKDDKRHFWFEER